MTGERQTEHTPHAPIGVFGYIVLGEVMAIIWGGFEVYYEGAQVWPRVAVALIGVPIIAILYVMALRMWKNE